MYFVYSGWVHEEWGTAANITSRKRGKGSMLGLVGCIDVDSVKNGEFRAVDTGREVCGVFAVPGDFIKKVMNEVEDFKQACFQYCFVGFVHHLGKEEFNPLENLDENSLKMIGKGSE